jgi:hypothetical protein
MSTIVYPADSTTLILNGYAVTNFSEGDYITLTPANPLTSRVNSASGGVSIAGTVNGGVHDLVFRVQLNSPCDVYFNAKINSELPVVFEGSIKRSFFRDGVAFVDSRALEGGSITTQPTDTINNTDGNAIREYTIQFRNAVRSV